MVGKQKTSHGWLIGLWFIVISILDEEFAI